jgi:predicted metal-binding membrane protein
VSAVPVTGRPRPGRLQRTAWRHPEWTVALVAVACWALLAALHARGFGLPDGHDPGAAHTAPDPTVLHHAATHHGAHPTGHPGAEPAPPPAAEPAGGWLAAQGNWLLMAPAMMLPSALPAARHVALNSRWRRRQRGGAVFVATYLALWLLFGLVVVSIAGWAHVPTGASWPLALALVVAAGWELTAVKRRCLRACHRTVPLPPDRWKADAACVRFGLRYGWSCLGACWALMLPMAIAGHAGLLLMVVLTAIVVAEEGLVKGTRLGRAAALVLVAAAAMVAAAA